MKTGIFEVESENLRKITLFLEKKFVKNVKKMRFLEKKGCF